MNASISNSIPDDNTLGEFRQMCGVTWSFFATICILLPSTVPPTTGRYTRITAALSSVWLLLSPFIYAAADIKYLHGLILHILTIMVIIALMINIYWTKTEQDKEVDAVEFELLDLQAKAPERQSQGAAGYDIFALQPGFVDAGQRVVVRTGWRINNMPGDVYARIAPRSGLAVKNSIDTVAGVVDSDYKLEVGVVLANNHGQNTFRWEAGHRIAQLIFERIRVPQTGVKSCNGRVVNAKAVVQERKGGFGASGL